MLVFCDELICERKGRFYCFVGRLCLIFLVQRHVSWLYIRYKIVRLSAMISCVFKLGPERELHELWYSNCVQQELITVQIKYIYRNFDRSNADKSLEAVSQNGWMFREKASISGVGSNRWVLELLFMNKMKGNFVLNLFSAFFVELQFGSHTNGNLDDSSALRFHGVVWY